MRDRRGGGRGLRQGRRWKCALCGRVGTRENPLNQDHIIPYSLGGPTEPWNLRWTCVECNMARGNRMTRADAALAAARKARFGS